MFKKRVEDDILILTIENGKDNSLTAEFFTALRDIVAEVNQSRTPKGIVLTGEGRFFSSGFNLPMFLGFKDAKEVGRFFSSLEEPVLLDLFTCQKPVIAALNGHTVAGGLILAMAADYRLATPNPKAKYGMSEIKIGLPLAIAQGEIVRFGIADDRNYRDLVYFGQMMDVQKAKELRLVDEIVEEAELLPRAKALVAQFIDQPGRAFTPIKGLLRRPLSERIQKAFAECDWEKSVERFFAPDVRKALEFTLQAMSR